MSFPDRSPRRQYTTPIPAALLGTYERELATYGRVTDHFGLGTWTIGESDFSNVAFAAGNHVEIATRLSVARRFLPKFLARLRRDLDQREALGEIVGGAYGVEPQHRERIEVVLPFTRADYRTLLSLHRIFGAGGRRGASQFDDARDIHVYSGTRPQWAARVELALKNANLPYTKQPETSVVDDAPPCPQHSL